MNIFGTELYFYEINLPTGRCRLLPCHNAECFSREALRSLLLSDDGDSIVCVAALSINEGKVRYRAEFLEAKP